MKKLAALLLALVLVLSLCPVAFASALDDSHLGLGQEILCHDCGRTMSDCICDQNIGNKSDEENTDLRNIDYSWYLPVYLQRSRDIFGLRENTVRVELRPELDENGTLIYSMTENYKNQLANNLRHIWLEEDGIFLNARTVVQYDLSYALERHKLATPGDKSDLPTKLKFENVPGLVCEEPSAIRTKINVQDVLIFEPASVGAFSMGFSMGFQVGEDGYEVKFVNDKGENCDDMLMQDKAGMIDFSWKLNDGKWYHFGEEHEENISDKDKDIYDSFSKLLIKKADLNASEKNPDFHDELETRIREERAREKLKLTEDNMSDDRLFTQGGKLYWQVDESNYAELDGLLSLDYSF